jgi:hypothetical protein
MSARFGLGIDRNQVVTSDDGLILFMPACLSVTYRSDAYGQIELSGIIMDKDMVRASRLQALKDFTIIELMEEVQGRIKSGENKKERKKCN